MINAKQILDRMGILTGPGGRALGRRIGLAAVVGVVAGLGAIVFHLLCLFITHFALTEGAGYEQGGPANETELHNIVHMEKHESDSHGVTPWLLIVIPAVGGLASGYLVFKYAPEAEGHGTDAAIRAYHHERGMIRARVPIVKMITSAITLGTGGSGGREGPIAQIGAGFGSYLATRLKLSDSERRMLMAAGLGAGIGAIFHAPLAGAIFAIEVMYRDPDFEAEALIPAFISTAIAYSVFSLGFGADAFKPLFHVAPDMTFTKPFQLMLPLAALAVVMVVAAYGYTKCFYGTHNLFKKLKIPKFTKPMIGGALTGAIALVLYFAMSGAANNAQHDSLSVLSFGYGFLQKVLHPEQGVPIAISILLVVGIGKILTTALTIGSGGSGGVFGPSMVIGGSLGAVVGTVFHNLLPGVVGQSDIVIFAILGMASFFAAAANTPVSTLIMVSEMTASYVLLLPSMWVCALAYLIKGKWTLYEEQVGSRLESPAHRADFIVDVLKGLSIRDAFAESERKFITVPLDMPLSELAKLVTSTTQTSFPVVDDNDDYYGLFSLQDIRQFLYEGQVGMLAVAQDLATPNVEPLELQLDLSSAITRFAQERFEELPVIDENDPTEIIGTLRRQDVISVYERRLLEVKTAPLPKTRG